MKAPDKIYLNTPKIQPELDNTTWDTKTYADCENVEYIRKDALLELAKERLDFACALKSEGQKTVCKEFIDKLNSM